MSKQLQPTLLYSKPFIFALVLVLNWVLVLGAKLNNVKQLNGFQSITLDTEQRSAKKIYCLVS